MLPTAGRAGRRAPRGPGPCRACRPGTARRTCRGTAPARTAPTGRTRCSGSPPAGRRTPSAGCGPSDADLVQQQREADRDRHRDDDRDGRRHERAVDERQRAEVVVDRVPLPRREEARARTSGTPEPRLGRERRAAQPSSTIRPQQRSAVVAPPSRVSPMWRRRRTGASTCFAGSCEDGDCGQRSTFAAT